MRSRALSINADGRMTAMRNRNRWAADQMAAAIAILSLAKIAEKKKLKVPALRVRHQKVAENLDARDRLEFLGIDKIGIHRERVGFAEKLDQAAVFLDQIVRQHRDAEPALACAQDTKHVIDGQMRRARPFAVAADLEQPSSILQMRRHDAAAEKNNAVFVEILVRAGRAEPFQIVGRGISVRVH